MKNIYSSEGRRDRPAAARDPRPGGPGRGALAGGAPAPASAARHRGRPAHALPRPQDPRARQDPDRLRDHRPRAPSCPPRRGGAPSTGRWPSSCSRCGPPPRSWWSAPRPRAPIPWPAPSTRPSLPEVVGTIAGDDTVFVAATGPAAGPASRAAPAAPPSPARTEKELECHAPRAARRRHPGHHGSRAARPGHDPRVPLRAPTGPRGFPARSWSGRSATRSASAPSTAAARWGSPASSATARRSPTSCDVFVLDGHRGRGVGKRIMACITSHPELQNLRLWTLFTRDAHGLYRQHGFRDARYPDRLMERRAERPAVAGGAGQPQRWRGWHEHGSDRGDEGGGPAPRGDGGGPRLLAGGRGRARATSTSCRAGR